MESPAATLRLAHPLEARALAELSRDLIETGLEWRYTPPRMAEMLRDADHSGVVACDAARVLGFAVMHFGDEDAHLCLLAVHRQAQRRGLGVQLVGWLAATARVAGIARIGLELRADNAAALAFYRRLGFAETGLVPGYYGGTIAARRMRLTLRQGVVPPA